MSRKVRVMHHLPRLAVWLALASAAALVGTRAAAQDRPPREKRRWAVTAATSPVTVDGVLDEPAWSDALRLELAYEVRPGENIPAPVTTEMMITYDRSRLLVAFVAHDPDPSQIRAHFTDRDQAWEDDIVQVVLDTFNDGRRAYEFTCNPLGVQTDAINDDAGGSYDESWDAIWASAGRITAAGYQVEMAIPFNQIRFQPGGGEQVWGVDGVRSWPRRDTHHIGLWPRDRGANTYLGQADTIVGFAGVTPGRNLELAPTLTASRTDRREDFPHGPLESGPVETEVGLTGRWGVTPSVTLSAAANPDFSQVEADALQLEVNQQFALFYPEKRPFFLEGVDYFSTPIQLLHTRSIADPSAALKVTGRQGPHTFGLFSAEDQITNLLVPGVEGSVEGSFDLNTIDTVGRYRRDVGAGSTVGAMLTDREGGGYFNRVVSLDARWRPNDADSLTLDLAGSATRYAEEMIAELGLPRGEIRDHAASASYRHSVRDWAVFASLIDRGEDFRADLGFVSQVGFRRVTGGAERHWWGEPGDPFNWLGLTASLRYAEDQDGNLLERWAGAWLSYEGPLESSAGVGLYADTVVFREVAFDRLSADLYFEMRPIADLEVELFAAYGDAIDYAEVRPGTSTLVEPELSYRLGRHLSLELAHSFSALDVDGGRLFEAYASEARVVYQLNRSALVRLILQRSDIRRSPELHTEPVEPRTRDLLAQLLLSYKVNPQTVVFLGYSDGRAGDSELPLTRTDRTFFVKLGYAWLW